MWGGLLTGIIYLQIQGFYNPTYIIYEECGNTIAIQKTTKMTLNTKIKELETKNINNRGDPIWDSLAKNLTWNNTMT